MALAALALALWVAAPSLTAIGNWNLLFFFVLLVGAAVLLGVPIAFAFGLATVAYLLTSPRRRPCRSWWGGSTRG